MALINQQGMYQSAAPLNPLPYVNIAMQARQRKAAREEAIDKYYQKLPDTINDKGVRDNEVPIINEGKNKIFEFGVKNREALRNPKLDNGAAQLTLDKMMRELSGIARESQNRAKTDLQLGKWRFSKEKEYIFKKPTFMQLHDAHNKTIGEEGSKGIDIASLDIPPKPLDLNSLRKELKDFKYSEGTPIVSDHPTDKSLQVVTSNPQFDEDSKKKLYDFAATKLHTDDSFEETIKNGLAETGLLQNLVEIAKKQFGVQDVSNMTDEDLAAAFLYSQIPTSKTESKVQPNYTNRTADKRTYDEAEWDRRTAANQRNSLEKIAANKRAQGLDGNETTGNAFDELGGVQPIYLQSGGKIDKGVVFDKDGNLYNGTIVGKKEWLPANVTTSLAASKVPIDKFMDIVVKDGVVQSLRTKNGEVSRQAMENLQKKANVEPLKAAQPVYGKPQGDKKQAPAKTKPKSDPLGLGF